MNKILIAVLLIPLSVSAFFDDDADFQDIFKDSSGNTQVNTFDYDARSSTPIQPRKTGTIWCSFGNCSGSLYNWDTDTYQNINYRDDSQRRF